MVTRQLGKYGETSSTILYSLGGFKQSKQDSRKYLRRTGTGFVVVIVVDYMVLAANQIHLLEEVKSMFTRKFKVKLLGSLRCFIGWEILRTPSGLYVHQHKYLSTRSTSVLCHHTPHLCPCLTTCLLFTTKTFRCLQLLIPSIVPSSEESFMQPFVHAQTSFAASVLARQVHAPAERHYVLAKSLLRYLSVTMDLALFIPKPQGPSEPLSVYCDADWAGCHDTRKSTTQICASTVSAVPFWRSSAHEEAAALDTAQAETDESCRSSVKRRSR